MRKFKLMLAVLMVVGMYACNEGTTSGTTPHGTDADSTNTHSDGESHEGHDH